MADIISYFCCGTNNETKMIIPSILLALPKLSEELGLSKYTLYNFTSSETFRSARTIKIHSV